MGELKYFYLLIFLYSFFIANLFGAQVIKVNNISFLEINNYCRIVFDLNKKIEKYDYKFDGNSPEGLVYLYFPYKLSLKKKITFPKNSFFSKLTMLPQNNATKIFLRVTNIRKVITFSIGGIDAISPKFIITLFKREKPLSSPQISNSNNDRKKASKIVKRSVKTSKEKKSKKKKEITSQIPFKIPVVVIDPGHGGKDPGAIGRRGTKEKDIVFDVAKRVYKILRENEKGKMKVYLTRASDKFIPLDYRRQFAEEKRADVFVSIHANSSVNGKGRGIEIFYSGKPSDEEAAKLAESENAVDVIGIKGFNFVKDQKVRKILIDMKKNKTIEESAKLASFIFNKFKTNKLRVRKIRRAEFVVLRSVIVPSVLIEIGFISNWLEERMLSKVWYREKLATYIAQGIIDYLMKERRELRAGLKKIKKKKYLFYVVKKGDTLSQIAKKFSLSLKELKQLNKIRNPNKISIGTKLKVYVYR